jgi:3alpha(or 20beta)-hydroxysteroid dehydrogenase
VGSLEGRVAIITGAARGQGLAEAERFVAEGARVVLVDVLDDLGDAAAAALGSNARYAHLDVTDEVGWHAVVERTVTMFGGLDILVNNAAIYRVATLEETDAALFRQVLEVNLVGPFLGILATTAALRERGGGSIINVSSANGIRGAHRASAYASSKFGLRGLTKSAAIELGPAGIRVNAILPGTIRTEMIRYVLDHEEQIAAPLPMRRIGEPHDVAGAALWLAGDDSLWVTGTDVVVDGGFTA